MKRSIDRILTTHVGSLPRPDDLRAMLDVRRRGEDYDHRAFDSRLGSAVQETVNEQIESGLDVVNDGEMAKMSWSGYIRDRLGGYEVKPLVSLIGREQHDFPEYAQGRVGGRTDATPSMVATGPVEYIGQQEIHRDIANLREALFGKRYVEAFMAAVGPDNVGYQPGQNEYYKSDEEYIEANARALKTEYKAIADAGFILQIDTPVMKYNALSLTVEDFRKRFSRLMELYNDVLADIPEDQIRLHICYGGMRAPHSGDIHLDQYADILVKARAAAFSLDQNVQHEHEWRVWKDVKLPGRALVPASSRTPRTRSAPSAIADRLVRRPTWSAAKTCSRARTVASAAACRTDRWGQIQGDDGRRGLASKALELARR